MIIRAHVVIPFRPYGVIGEIAPMMLICLLHHSYACLSQYCFIPNHLSTTIFIHSIVLDVDAHVISKPEHYGSMGILM